MDRSLSPTSRAPAPLDVLLAQPGVGAARLDLGGRFEEVSARLCELVGRTPAQLRALALHEVAHPADAGAVREALAALEREGIPRLAERRYLRPDGASVWVSEGLTLERDEGGGPRGALLLVHDLSELRWVEARYAELLAREAQARLDAESHRERLHRLFQQAPALVNTHRGPEHVFEIVHPLTARLLGGRELVGRPVREAIPELAGQGLFERMDAVYRTGEPYHGREVPARLDRSGTGQLEDVYFDLTVQPTRTVHGGIEGVMMFAVDVTDQVRARRRVEQEADLTAFLAQASDALASSLDYEDTLARAARLAVPTLGDWCLADVVDEEGRFKRVEVAHAQGHLAPAAHGTLRLPPVPGGHPLHPPTRALRERRVVRVEGVDDAWRRACALDEEHLAQMRAIGFHSLLSVPLVARGHALGVLTFLAVAPGRRFGDADVARAEELARRAALAVDNARLYREAQQAVRLRDEFLSVASHELKTPLTPLSLKLQALARTTTGGALGAAEAQRVSADVEVMRRQVKRLSALVDDLLDVSRISTGRLRLHLEDVDLTALVQEVLARFEAEAQRAECRLHVALGAPCVGRWDRLRLEQVVSNLLSNALKYGAGRPVHVAVADEGEGGTRLEVRDEGIGIAPEEQARIFHKFERAVSERHYGGLGLGLYVTRQIVEALGGSVQVESAPGQGATFRVRLPRAAPRG